MRKLLVFFCCFLIVSFAFAQPKKVTDKSTKLSFDKVYCQSIDNFVLLWTGESLDDGVRDEIIIAEYVEGNNDVLNHVIIYGEIYQKDNLDIKYMMDEEKAHPFGKSTIMQCVLKTVDEWGKSKEYIKEKYILIEIVTVEKDGKKMYTVSWEKIL